MAQHHDSFSLYDSEHTLYDSVDMGPKRDLCQEIKVAVKELTWRRDDEALHIAMPEQPTPSAAYALRLEFAGELPSPKQ